MSIGLWHSLALSALVVSSSSCSSISELTNEAAETWQKSHDAAENFKARSAGFTVTVLSVTTYIPIKTYEPAPATTLTQIARQAALLAGRKYYPHSATRIFDDPQISEGSREEDFSFEHAQDRL